MYNDEGIINLLKTKKQLSLLISDGKIYLFSQIKWKLQTREQDLSF